MRGETRRWAQRSGYFGLALAFVALLLVSCGGDDTPAGIRTVEPGGTEQPATPGGDATPTPAEPTPTPTPDPAGAFHGLECDEREPLRQQLAADVEAALEGYNGDWGFALYDLRCDAMATANADHVQYAASSSKILSAIAVLRGVEAGDIALEAVEPHLHEVFTWSSDADANALETFLEPGALLAVMEDAGVSEASHMEAGIEAWNYTFMTAPDMARVWAALVRGELLGEEMTAYLLEKTTLADIPEGLETFPGGDFDWPGFDYGQKAGYYVIDGVPLHWVGAGWIDEAGTPEQFIPVILLWSMNPEFLDPQRRDVWPLIIEHIAEVTGAEMPPEVGPGP